MSNHLPLVSIGMSVFNNQSTIGSALRSILDQQYPNWELLLFDDGSQDSTLQEINKIKDSRIFIQQDGKRLGLAARMNQAILLSKGKYFARMDGDDISYPRRISTQVKYLESHQEVDLLGASMVVFGEKGIPLGKRGMPLAHNEICARPYAGFPLSHPTYMGKTDWFRRYGYDEKMKKTQDQDLLLRAYRFSRFANLPEILVGYREEKLHLKKILTSRLYFCRALIREFTLQQNMPLAVRAISGQILKSFIDCFAIGSGLKYTILRHRANSLTIAEKHEWNTIWNSVSTVKSAK